MGRLVRGRRRESLDEPIEPIVIEEGLGGPPQEPGAGRPDLEDGGLGVGRDPDRDW